ncbi:MAG: Fic family protein [Terracidiphilus sp.]
MNATDYDAFDDPYAYPGTSVLKNRLELQDPGLLEAFEVEIFALRSAEPLPTGAYDPAHYRKVHHHLFQDVYEWAGQYRTVRTSKGGNAFCYPEHIPQQTENLFQTIRGGAAFFGKGSQEFVKEAARFLGELNAIHPFREGNGRSQLAFMGLIAFAAGHPLKLERLDKSTFLPAMIESYFRKYRALNGELEKLLN